MCDSWAAKIGLDTTSRFSGPGTPTAGLASKQPRDVITRTEQQAEYLQLLEEKLAGQRSLKVHIADAVATSSPPTRCSPG